MAEDTVNAANTAAQQVRSILSGLAEDVRREQRDAIESVREILRGLAEDVRREQTELADSIRGAAGESFRNIFTAATTGARDFGDVLRGVAQRFVDLATEILIIRPLLEGLFGASGGPLGGLFGSLFGGGGGLPQGFQQGGLARRGFAIVGEGGPELVDFRNPSRVYPNEDLAAAIGSSGDRVVVNQNMTFNGVEPAGLMAAGRQIQAETQAAVISYFETNARRPSGLRRAISGR